MERNASLEPNSVTSATSSFARLLREFRVAAGLTQEELAARSGVSVRAISDLERGAKTHPQQATVQLLGDGLGLSDLQRAALAAAVPKRQSSTGRALQTLDLPVGGFLGAVPDRTLVARTGEVQQIRSLMEAAKGGDGQLLVLAGEPGAGKTRLAQEATLICRANGMHVVTGRCYEPLSSVAYSPFLEIFSRLIPSARVALGLDPLVRWPALHPLLPEDARSAEPGSRSLGEEGNQMRLFWAVTGLLEALSQQIPLVVALDDLHWADQSSLNLLLHLVRQLRHVPILFIVTYREHEISQNQSFRRALRDLHREHLAEQIVVGGFRVDGTAALMAVTLGAREVAARFVAMVHRQTEGNAFFIEEVVRALAERGDAQLLDGIWDYRSGDELAIPHTVSEAIEERSSRLSTDVQGLLGAASVLGESFGFDELQATSGRAEEEIDEGLLAAIQASLIRPGAQDGYAFNHVLTQQVFYRGLTPQRRKRLHLAAGNAIEVTSERTQDRRAAELARHFLRGGAQDRALHYALLAGDQDEARFAHEEAERHYRLGLDCARNEKNIALEAVALEKLGRVLTNVGRYPEARELLERSIACYREVDDPDGEVRATVQIGSVYRATGMADSWIERVQALLARLDVGRPPAGVVEIYIVLEVLLNATGRYREGLAAAERATQLAQEAGDAAVLARAETGRGSELLLLGLLDDALLVLEGAIALPEAADDPFNLVRALDVASQGHRLRGNPLRSRELEEQSVALSERIQSPWDTAMALSGLAESERLLGDWALARRYLERATGLIHDLPTSGWAVGMHVELGELTAAEGDWERASGILQDALASARRGSDLERIRAAERVLAELDVLGGRPEEARLRLEPLLDRPGLEELQVTEFLPVLAAACEACGDAAEAEGLIQAAIRRATAVNALLVLAESLIVRGRLLAARDEAAAAECDLTEAARLAHAMPCPYLEGRALFTRGTVAHSRADLEQARDIFARLGARRFLERAEEALGLLSNESSLCRSEPQ